MENRVMLDPCGKELEQTVWKKSPAQVFWGEIATCEHSVQLYENDKVFLNTLESFAGAGLIAGDSVIIIATPEHLASLEVRLVNQGFNIQFLTAADRYIGLDASETLKSFMIDDDVDEERFMKCICDVIHRAQRNNGRIRAFGEMVAVLWEQGRIEASIKLEKLWNKLHHVNNFTLFCAYPKQILSGSENAVTSIYDNHSKVIDGSPRPSTEIYYKGGFYDSAAI